MQFHNAETSDGHSHLSFVSLYERIKGLFTSAGYEMPELVLWSLTGGCPAHGQYLNGDLTALRPVTT
ncbi:hypothetical protein F5Y03DRAFT_143075 [Xylaria venustula]|nr:hypothetical protein F5Y03DRAFT_143075 [Xylaria venustula]